MSIEGLGYVGVRAKSLEDWSNFGTRFLGMQLVDKSAKSLALRMDDRRQRVVVTEDGGEGVGFFGWEVPDARSTRRDGRAPGEGRRAGRPRFARARAGAPGQGPDRIQRPARQPAGDFPRAETTSEPFKPGRSISGFRTGPLGMGHAVLHVKNINDAVPFYRDVLGFKLSDYMMRPFNAYFFHANPRHHSIAFIETGTQRHASPDGGALQPRRCRPVLRSRADRSGEADRRDARPPYQRRGDVVLLELAVELHVRVRLGWTRYRRRQLARGRGDLGTQHVGPRPHVAAARDPRRGAQAAHPGRLHRAAQAGQRDRGQLPRHGRRLPWWDAIARGEAAE